MGPDDRDFADQLAEDFDKVRDQGLSPAALHIATRAMHEANDPDAVLNTLAEHLAQARLSDERDADGYRIWPLPAGPAYARWFAVDQPHEQYRFRCNCGHAGPWRPYGTLTDLPHPSHHTTDQYEHPAH